MKFTKGFMVLGLSSVLMLTACGEEKVNPVGTVDTDKPVKDVKKADESKKEDKVSEDKADVSTSSKEKEEVAKVEVEKVTETTLNKEVLDKKDTKQEVRGKEVGTITNPVKFGNKVRVIEKLYDNDQNSYDVLLDLKVDKVVRGEEAWKIVKKENPSSEPADAGYEYVIATVTGNVTKSEFDSYYWLSEMNFTTVTTDGTEYAMKSPIIPNPLTADMYEGTTKTGNIGRQVKVGEDFKLKFKPNEGKSFYLNVK